MEDIEELFRGLSGFHYVAYNSFCNLPEDRLREKVRKLRVYISKSGIGVDFQEARLEVAEAVLRSPRQSYLD